MLSQLPEVAEALRVGTRPGNIDAETWSALRAFVGTRQSCRVGRAK
jgi:hypothetical protein